MGCWVPGPLCLRPPGAALPAARALGDVFKAGPLMNYRHFTDTLGQRFGYAGPVQLHLQSDGPRTLLDIWVSDLWDERRSDAVVAELFATYEPLQCVAEAALPLRAAHLPRARCRLCAQRRQRQAHPCLRPPRRSLTHVFFPPDHALGELLAFVRAHSAVL